jgi:prolyl 4-hydroxylase
VYSAFSQTFDDSIRVIETAILESDEVVRKIRTKAKRLQGWRARKLVLEELKVQYYGVNGFSTFHYDWVSQVTKGNRAITFIIYLVANCTDGSTNFPKLEAPFDERWCSVIE